jgi:hypothetical protein
MQNTHNHVGVPVGEPKDGDFVAYLAQIEKRQLAALAALPARSAHTPPELNGPHTPSTETHEDWTERAPLGAAEAERLRQQLALDSRQRKGLVGAAFMGLFGLFFTVQGLLGDGGIVALLIGVFLLWRAWIAVRAALGAASTAQRDLAARLIDTLRQAQKR